MAATAVLWGSAFTAIQFALPDYAPASIALLRIAVTVVLLVPCLVLGRIGPLRRQDALRMAAFGLTGMTAYQVLLCAGEESVDAGTAAMLIAASPSSPPPSAWRSSVTAPGGADWPGWGWPSVVRSWSRSPRAAGAVRSWER
ncbi:EamA family transporter [Streptomyces stramineus]